jgi:DNA-binding transcriptional LysR family regulator
VNEVWMMRIFVQVVEDGSFSATARRKNMSVSAIARQIVSLEESIGARLLNRTTRHQGLTEVGRIYYERARQIIKDIEDINQVVSSFYGETKGLLKVHIRTSASHAIIPELPRFLEMYPEVTLDLTLTEERVDLVSAGVDVAVWLANLEDSNLVARRLTLTNRVVCGSPSYFEKHGTPKTPQDLSSHNCILFTGSSFSSHIWRFSKGDETVDIQVAGNVKTATAWMLYDIITSGLGITIIQHWMVRGALQDGRLVQVLADYNPNPVEFDIPLYAVYPHSHGLPPKTRAFIDFLVSVFKDIDDQRVEEQSAE